MSFALLEQVKETIKIGNGSITVYPLTLDDLQITWLRRGDELRSNFDAILKSQDSIDPNSLLETMINKMPDVIYDLLLLSARLDVDNNTERQSVAALPVGTLCKIAITVYQLTMIDADDLKKTLSNLIQNAKKLSPTQQKVMNATR